VTAKT